MQEQYQGADILHQILKSAMQGASGMAQQSANSMASQPLGSQVAQTAGIQSGVGPGNEIIGSLLKLLGGGMPSANAAEPGKQGGQQQQKPQQTAYQKGVDKALNENGYTHANEALLHGMDPMMIANHSSQMGFQNSMNNMTPLLQNLLSAAQAPQSQQIIQADPYAQQAAAGLEAPKKRTPLQMLTGIGSPGNEVYQEKMKGMRLDNVGKAQKISGQEPLQQGDREKAGLETAKSIAIELAKKGNPDALTPEASAKFNLIIDGNNATKEMADILVESPGVVWSAPSFLKSQKGRQYEAAVKRAIRNKLRLESGATIGDKEVDEEYKKYEIGKTDSKETIRRKLSPLNNFYEGSLNVADPTGVHRQRASGSQNQTNIGRFQVRYH